MKKMRKFKISDVFINRWGRMAFFFVVLIMFAFALSVLISGCKKETCYSCSTYDNSTGYIWDVECVCGEAEATDYVAVFNDIDNTAVCISHE